MVTSAAEVAAISAFIAGFIHSQKLAAALTPESSHCSPGIAMILRVEEDSSGV